MQKGIEEIANTAIESLVGHLECIGPRIVPEKSAFDLMGEVALILNFACRERLGTSRGGETGVPNEAARASCRFFRSARFVRLGQS